MTKTAAVRILGFHGIRKCTFNEAEQNEALVACNEWEQNWCLSYK